MSAHDKQELVTLIDTAVHDGAYLKSACADIGFSARSYQRWKSGKLEDQRKGSHTQVYGRLCLFKVLKFYKCEYYNK